MELLTANLVSGQSRREVVAGREYIVAPMTLIVPGVLNGSKGPLYYPPQEIARAASAWNGQPLVLRHPTHPMTNQPLSASSQGVWERSGLGRVRNAKVTADGKLKAEGWFDAERTRQLAPHVYRDLSEGNVVPLSTGLFTDNEPAGHGAAHNGRRYHAVARNHKPDHLAILDGGEVGACSINDGCGVLVNRAARSAVRMVLNAARASGALPATSNSTSDDIDPDKACQIMRDGEANGHPLTEAQRGLFGAARGRGREATKNAYADPAEALWLTYNRDWPQEKRDKLADKDFAGPDQSFPIQKQSDVDAASHLVGKAADPGGVKRRIKAIAARRGLEVPEAWRDDDETENCDEGPMMKPVKNAWSDAAREAALAARRASAEADKATRHSAQAKEFSKEAKGHAGAVDTEVASDKAQALHETAASFHKQAARALRQNDKPLAKSDSAAANISKAADLHDEAAMLHTDAAAEHGNELKSPKIAASEAAHKANEDAAGNVNFLRADSLRALHASKVGNDYVASRLHSDVAERAGAYVRQMDRMENTDLADKYRKVEAAHKAAAETHRPVGNSRLTDCEDECDEDDEECVDECLTGNSEDQPRDEHGRFAAGAASSAASQATEKTSGSGAAKRASREAAVASDRAQDETDPKKAAELHTEAASKHSSAMEAHSKLSLPWLKRADAETHREATKLHGEALTKHQEAAASLKDASHTVEDTHSKLTADLKGTKAKPRDDGYGVSYKLPKTARHEDVVGHLEGKGWTKEGGKDYGTDSWKALGKDTHMTNGKARITVSTGSAGTTGIYVKNSSLGRGDDDMSTMFAADPILAARYRLLLNRRPQDPPGGSVKDVPVNETANEGGQSGDASPPGMDGVTEGGSGYSGAAPGPAPDPTSGYTKPKKPKKVPGLNAKEPCPDCGKMGCDCGAAVSNAERCPRCGGDMDEDGECEDCGYVENAVPGQPRHLDSGQYLHAGGRQGTKQVTTAVRKGSGFEQAQPPGGTTVDELRRQPPGTALESESVDDHQMDDAPGMTGAERTSQGMRSVRESRRGPSDNMKGTGTTVARTVVAKGGKGGGVGQSVTKSGQSTSKSTSTTSTGTQSISKGVSTVNREQVIRVLTANCACWRGGDDVLNAMSDEQLRSVARNAKSEGSNADDANASDTMQAGGEEDDKNKNDEEREEDVMKQVASKSKGMSTNAWLAAAPPEVKAVLNYGVEALERDKRNLIKRLLVNVASPEDRKRKGTFLLRKSVEELRELSSLVPAVNSLPSSYAAASMVASGEQGVANFLGAAGGAFESAPTANFDKDDILPLPVMNYGREAEEDVAAAIG